MGLHAWLNTPLLRGKAAERWARPLVQIPVLGLACATALAVTSTLFGLAGAAVFFGLSMLPVKFSSSRKSKLAAERTGAKAAWDSRFDGAAKDVRAFMQRHLPPHVTIDDDNKVDTVAYTLHGPKTAQIGLQFAWFANKASTPEEAKRWACYAAAHEIAHTKEGDYWFKHALSVAGRVCTSTAIIGAGGGLLALGVTALPFTGLAALASAALPTLSLCFFNGALGRVGVFLASKIYQRQSEYHCDREAVALTRDVEGMIGFAKQTRGFKGGRPSLAMNVLTDHPCFHNRVREVTHYMRELLQAPTPAPKP